MTLNDLLAILHESHAQYTVEVLLLFLDIVGEHYTNFTHNIVQTTS